MLLPVVIGAAALGLLAMKRRRRCHAPHDRGCGGRGRRRRGWGRGRLYHLMASLGTTPGQEKVLREELHRLRGLGLAARDEAFAGRGDLADALRGESFDRTQFEARLDGAYAALKAAVAESLGRVHATLDARQREQLADLLGDGRGARPGPFRS